MEQPKSIEEGLASLSAILSDEALEAAASGEYGNEVRLITLSERARRFEARAS